MFHRVGDRMVHSLSFGSGPGTLFGVPGAFANWEIWAPVFEQLSPDWRVVTFDQDGVGQTKAPVEHITRERQRESLFSVLDAQAVERCVIAGDSNNATLAIEAVLEQPERFDGLVVLNGRAWGFESDDTHRFVAGLSDHFEATVDFFVEVVFPEDGAGHLKAWLRDIITRTGADAAAHIVEMYYGVDLRDRLSDIDLPALVVHGALDVLSPNAQSDAEALASALGAELELLPDAGHLPLLSRPQAVADHLIAFLSRTT